MGIIAHTLAKNEERFIWFAINSVIDHIDRMLVWDNGSTDATVMTVKTIKNSKIKFRDASNLKPEIARQEMLSESKSFDWIFILDGDEVWHIDSIKNLKFKIENCTEDVIVVPNYMLVGDVFHYQEKRAGRYNIAGRVGHYNIRAIRNVPGLHVEGVYPNEACVTREGIKVQDLPKDRILFLDEPYLHTSFLPRSDRGEQKRKYEIGEEFARDFYYPEVFFKPRPSIIPSPWERMGFGYKFRAFFETPLKKVKRRII